MACLLYTSDYLGRYIYLLDAYDDLEEDKKKQCFNPLLEEAKKSDFDERMRTILELMISASCEACLLYTSRCV